jgi:thioredoxin reductase
MSENEWDVVIVGAGPAGLSAALILGRCCRRVLLCDRGTPRSWASHAIHGFLSRDGIHPDQFRHDALGELARYPNVEVRWEEVVHAQPVPGGSFSMRLEKGAEVRSRKLLLATGLMDELPPVPDIASFFGKSVFHCPYCDGWELRDASIAVYGRGRRAFEMARAMTAWTRTILVCTDGPAALSREQRAALHANRISLESARIVRLHGQDGMLERIEFAGGREVPVKAMFFDMPSHPQSDLAKMVGCQFTSAGGIRCGRYEASSVPGVFVAGNILKDVQLSIVAAAEGARAAFGINRALTREDFERRAGAPPRIDHPGPQESLPAH